MASLAMRSKVVPKPRWPPENESGQMGCIGIGGLP